MFLGRTIHGDLHILDPTGAQQVFVRFQLRRVGHRPEARRTQRAGLLHDVLDDRTVCREERLAAKESDVPVDLLSALDAVCGLDGWVGGHDPVDHLRRHQAEQVPKRRIRAHVILEAVPAAEIAVVRRHEDVARCVPERATMDLFYQAGEVTGFLVGRHECEVAAPFEHLDRGV